MGIPEKARFTPAFKPGTTLEHYLDAKLFCLVKSERVDLLLKIFNTITSRLSVKPKNEGGRITGRSSPI